MAKILVVDDSSLSRRILRRILESAHHEVIEAGDGLTALEQYASHRPDAVFLDLTMRDMHGLEVLERLRELDPQARVIVATADIQSSTRELSYQAGACDIITKPYSDARVLDSLERALAK